MIVALAAGRDDAVRSKDSVLVPRHGVATDAGSEQVRDVMLCWFQAAVCCDGCFIGRCSYTTIKAQVDAFNAANRWRKRGVAVMPMKCVFAPLQRSMWPCSAFTSVFVMLGLQVRHQLGRLQRGGHYPHLPKRRHH